MAASFALLYVELLPSCTLFQYHFERKRCNNISKHFKANTTNWFSDLVMKLEGNGPVERAGRQCTEAVNGLIELRFNTFINK